MFVVLAIAKLCAILSFRHSTFKRQPKKRSETECSILFCVCCMSFINHINSVYQCVKVSMLSYNIYLEKTMVWIHARIFSFFATLYSAFIHLSRSLVFSISFGFLINKLNSWLFHQYKFLSKHSLVCSMFMNTHTQKARDCTKMCVLLLVHTCQMVIASFVRSVVSFSHFLFQHKNNSQFSLHLFTIFYMRALVAVAMLFLRSSFFFLAVLHRIFHVVVGYHMHIPRPMQKKKKKKLRATI